VVLRIAAETAGTKVETVTEVETVTTCPMLAMVIVVMPRPR
jgi:hypothetical protein